MPGFQAINYDGVRSSARTHSPADSEVADSQSAVHRRKREHTVFHFTDSQSDADGIEHFQLQWPAGRISERDLYSRLNGSEYAVFEGRQYDVLGKRPVPTQDGGNERFFEVNWQSSWHTVADLGNCPELLAAFRAKKALEKAALEARRRRSAHLTSVGAGQDVQLDAWQAAGSNSSEGKVSGEIILLPEFGKDYTQSWRQMRLSCLNSLPESRTKTRRTKTLNLKIKNRLLFSRQFCMRKTNNKGQFDVSNKRQARAADFHIGGIRQNVPCSFCATGKGTFLHCVTPRDKKAFKGACTCCAWKKDATKCDYHFSQATSLSRREDSHCREAGHSQMPSFGTVDRHDVFDGPHSEDDDTPNILSRFGILGISPRRSRTASRTGRSRSSHVGESHVADSPILSRGKASFSEDDQSSTEDEESDVEQIFSSQSGFGSGSSPSSDVSSPQSSPEMPAVRPLRNLNSQLTDGTIDLTGEVASTSVSVQAGQDVKLYNRHRKRKTSGALSEDTGRQRQCRKVDDRTSEEIVVQNPFMACQPREQFEPPSPIVNAGYITSHAQGSGTVHNRCRHHLAAHRLSTTATSKGVDFAHPDCAVGAPCRSNVFGVRLYAPRPGPSSLPGMVYKGTIFEEEEATTAQVHFILSQCRCEMAEYFDSRYHGILMARKLKPLEFSWWDVQEPGKAAILSHYMYHELNEAIRRFCPKPPTREPSVPIEVIVIED